MRWYFIDREKKEIHVYRTNQVSTLEFLGKTDNPWVRMAASHFVKQERGHKIIEH